ncbi:MAG TPA: neutral zinc metallopeptidase [Verrucomicrobiae bacterium]|nr:neutral zinc metallopeptidase [Verrucomicrobiae bacterium]
MRLDQEGESGNIEDRRGFRVSPGIAGGGIGTIVIVLIGLYLGIDPSALLQTRVDTSAPPAREAGAPDEMRTFVSHVLASTERTWSEIFEQNGRRYEPPKLVLFTEAVESACGFARTASGPFYCPDDRKVYIDLDFYRELRERFHAPGDFAQAYVIAHEVGHHVQNLLGTLGKAHAAESRAGRADANAISVRVELQADCLAGVWAATANRERKILEEGDVDEGLNAAAQIGDDRLQKRAQGYVVPEGFTHGSAEQRVRWFRRGLEGGDMSLCDTFSRGSV